ncbi:MAG: Quinoprotein glucose dehydrogenase [Daejeonella sp.]|nr:Quinoprotein glucose dehydrogenase [Daejeonella sp.]
MTKVINALLFLLSGSLYLTSCKFNENRNDNIGNDWPVYGGNSAGNRFSPLDQIDKQNVKQLQVAWTYNTGENADTTQRGREIQCQPIIVHTVMYGTTPELKVFAVNAENGKEIWKFDPFIADEPQYHSNRGVVYWEDGNEKRILFTAGSYLYALNADNGKLIESFGNNGKVELHEGLGTNLGHDLKDLMVISTSPGIIYKDLLILGSRVSEFGDAAPGHVRAYDVRTGKMRWIFHTVPLPGEYGYDSCPKDAYKTLGGANCWSGLVVDNMRGAVYFGTGSPSVDFYGGGRHGINLFSDCIMALNAETGKRIWHFQTIHHDLWDRDLPNPPNLITVNHDGKKIDAVAQTTKDGVVYVLDRDSGKPLFPVEERAVPIAGAVPGEQPSPTQPYPVKPAPFARQFYSESDVPDMSKEAQDFALKRFKETRSGNKFMPPSKEGTLTFFIGGGAEWGGSAADPDGVIYINSNEIPWDLRMTDIETKNKEIASNGKALYVTTCAVCHGPDRKGGGSEFPNLVDIGKRLKEKEIYTILKTGRGRMPSFQSIPDYKRQAIVNFLLNPEGSNQIDPHNMSKEAKAAKGSNFPYVPPYINNGQIQFLTPDGYPGIKPPWGTLNAINLNTGEFVWRIPFGEYPELKKKGIPTTGTENHGGPVVTASGLLFIGATRDEKFRAFDTKTGKILWEYQLPAGAFSTPASYMANNKQYIVVAAGGTKYGLKSGGSYIAFALPKD